MIPTAVVWALILALFGFAAEDVSPKRKRDHEAYDSKIHATDKKECEFAGAPFPQ
jgi:hypothetical protein